ncbi:MAG: Stf0 family sulfotransferase [Bacteroidota bacterium]
MKPTKTYRILMTQRSGSTFICECLKSTGIAGIPGEHFNLMQDKNLREKYGVTDYEGLRNETWKQGIGDNGVFGVKHDLHGTYYPAWVNELRELQGFGPEVDELTVWEDMFPNCSFIYLTRRNKIRQVVSWWKAIQDNIWHLQGDESHRNDASFYEEKYDLEALKTLLRQTNVKEAYVQEFFNRHKITPLTIVYEDFLLDVEGWTKRIVDFLEIPYETFSMGYNGYKKTSTDLSEMWVEKLTKDLYQWD